MVSITEDLVVVLQNPHPPKLYLNQGTKTNDTICQLQAIYRLQKREEIKDISSLRVTENKASLKVHKQSNKTPRTNATG